MGEVPVIVRGFGHEENIEDAEGAPSSQALVDQLNIAYGQGTLRNKLDKLVFPTSETRLERDLAPYSYTAAPAAQQSGTGTFDGVEETRKLLLPLGQLPSPETVLTWLTTPDGRKIPVSQNAFAKANAPNILELSPSGGFSLFSSVVEYGYDAQGLGERKTDNMMYDFLPSVLRVLYKDEDLPYDSIFSLDYEWSADKAKGGSTYSSPLNRLQRPDYLLNCESATLEVGEHKDKNLDDAMSDLEKYVKGGFSSMHYGNLDYILCYAAADKKVQLGVVRQNGEVIWDHVDRVFDLSRPAHRATFLYVSINTGRLLKAMVAALPPIKFRRTLMQPVDRGKGVFIVWQPGSKVEKIIQSFNDWVLSSPGTDLGVLQEVYQIASGSKHMVHASTFPELKYQSTYSVIMPAYGPPADPATIQDARGVAFACCTAARDLHSGGFVMRDFRRPNCVTRTGSEGDYVVLDLECSARSGAVWQGDFLSSWDDGTLERDNSYNAKSDMYQIGILLRDLDLWSVVPKTRTVQNFIDSLLKKELTAEAALQHGWLAGIN